jgi:hypothetical protein
VRAEILQMAELEPHHQSQALLPTTQAAVAAVAREPLAERLEEQADQVSAAMAAQLE